MARPRVFAYNPFSHRSLDFSGYLRKKSIASLPASGSATFGIEDTITRSDAAAVTLYTPSTVPVAVSGSIDLTGLSLVENRLYRPFLRKSPNAIVGRPTLDLTEDGIGVSGSLAGGNLYIDQGGAASTHPDSFLYFHEGGNDEAHHLMWDNDPGTFILSDNLEAENLLSRNNLYANFNGGPADSGVYFYAEGATTGASLLWDESDTGFQLSHHLGIGGTSPYAMLTLKSGDYSQFRIENDDADEEAGIRLRSNSAGGANFCHGDIASYSTADSTDQGRIGFKMPYNSSKGVGYKLNVDHLGQTRTYGSVYIGALEATEEDRSLYFYNGSETGAYLQWDDSPGEFVFSDPLNVTGRLKATNGWIHGMVSTDRPATYNHARYWAVKNSADATRWYKIATLPATASGTGDHLQLKGRYGIAGSGWYTFNVILQNRNSFDADIVSLEGDYSTYKPYGVIECYNDGAGTLVDVYMRLKTGKYAGMTVDATSFGWAGQSTFIDPKDVTYTTTNPSGSKTLVFDMEETSEKPDQNIYLGPTIVNGDIKANTNVYINYDGADGDSYLYFYNASSPTSRYIQWDESEDVFFTNNTFRSVSDIQAQGNMYVNQNGGDGDSALYFYENSSDFGAYLKWDDAPTGEFVLSHGLSAGADIKADGNVYINYDGADGDSFLYFYENSGAAGAYLQFDDSEDAFHFNHDLKMGTKWIKWDSTYGIKATRSTAGEAVIQALYDGSATSLCLRVNGAISVKDGMTAPATTTGHAKIYVDSADGDLKVKFGDGTVKTIVTDT